MRGVWVVVIERINRIKRVEYEIYFYFFFDCRFGFMCFILIILFFMFDGLVLGIIN